MAPIDPLTEAELWPLDLAQSYAASGNQMFDTSHPHRGATQALAGDGGAELAGVLESTRQLRAMHTRVLSREIAHGKVAWPRLDEVCAN